MTGAAATAALQRARGTGRIGARDDAGRTRLDTLYQDGCAKIRLPRTHSSALEAVLINTAGGLTGGDRLAWDAGIGEGARVVLTTQACERVYRSSGGAAEVATTLRIGDGAHLDWLPQETILFDEARLDRRLEVDLAPTASFTALEAVILGREAMGEDADSAALTDRWRIRRGGELIHAEATRLDAHDAVPRGGAALLDGARAFATLVHVGPEAERLLAPVRAALPAEALAAASTIGDKIVVRVLAPSGFALRRIVAPVIAHLSRAGTLPRMWSI